MIRADFLWLVAYALASCAKGVATPLQEDLNGVRVLGVAPTPVVSTLVTKGAAGTTMTLTVFVSAPKGTEVTLTPETAPGQVKIATTDMIVGPPSYEEHAGFRLARLILTVPVPDLSAFPNPTVNAAGTAGTTSAAGADSGTGVAAANDTGSLVSGNVNYSFSVAAGGSTLTADGSFLAAGAGHADLSFSSPEVTVNSPAPGARITTNGTALDLTASEVQTEQLITGWYTTDGSVKDRTLTSTAWVPGGSGAKSVVGTVRGARSHGFAIQVIDVDVE